MSNTATRTGKEWADFLHSVITEPNICAAVSLFHGEKTLPDLSPHLFGLLLQALTVVMKFEAKVSMLDTAHKINTHSATFIDQFSRFKVMLQFAKTMPKSFPRIHQDLPIDDIA